MTVDKTKKTIVIGHKNPDTDSICSAICYANLKQITSGGEYVLSLIHIWWRDWTYAYPRG